MIANWNHNKVIIVQAYKWGWLATEDSVLHMSLHHGEHDSSISTNLTENLNVIIINLSNISYERRQFSCSVMSEQVFMTPWTAACQASLSITNSWSLLKLMSIKLVIPSNHLILCHPLLLHIFIFINEKKNIICTVLTSQVNEMTSLKGLGTFFFLLFFELIWYGSVI